MTPAAGPPIPTVEGEVAPSPQMHPSPTFARAKWESLDGTWEFELGKRGDDPLTLEYRRTIEVPFPPESAASGIEEQLCEYPRYRRTFQATPKPGRRLLLHFEGVDYRSEVWVNGGFVGRHEGGYAPFVLDITDEVRAGDNVLVVAAHDDATDLEKPRGKQGWDPQPNYIWYRRSSGIWRSVWLEDVPARRLDAVWWTPLEPGILAADVRTHDADGLWVECSFRLGEQVLETVRGRVEDGRVSWRVQLTNCVDVADLLWSPERPTLVDVNVRLFHRTEVLDEVSSYTGLRTVATSGRNALINGEPVFLRLVLEQAYWPDSLFTAPSAAALRAEAELIRDLGFNGLRLHQVSADPRFLRACDELGLLILADLPAAHLWSTVAFRRSIRMLDDLVTRDHNHPSIIGWVPFNESWGLDGLGHDAAVQAAVVSLHAMVKALDPGRIVLGNDGWEHVVGDMVGIHDYSQDPALLRSRYGSVESVGRTLEGTNAPHRTMILGSPDQAVVLARGEQPVLLSEFGGITLATSEGSWPLYGEVSDADRLLRGLAELVGAVQDSPGLAGFCWTQLTDTLQEQNGLADGARVPKAPAHEIAAIVSGAGRAAGQ